MTDPWLPRDCPWYPRKNLGFWGKTWFCPTRDLPMTDPWFTHDNPWFFHGFECALYTLKISRKKMFFSLKNGIPWDDQFERFACSVDNSNFSATVGWPQSTLRILFGANLSIDCLWLLKRIEKRHLIHFAWKRIFGKTRVFGKTWVFSWNPGFVGQTSG